MEVPKAGHQCVGLGYASQAVVNEEQGVDIRAPTKQSEDARASSMEDLRWDQNEAIDERPKAHVDDLLSGERFRFRL